MPATRSPARSASSVLYRGSPPSGNIGPTAPNAWVSSLLLSRGVADDVSAGPPISPPARRRRTPNAFILYRSYIIANKLYPPELSHQSDVSRHVAEMWRTLTPSQRSIFFKMAEEKRRIQLDSHGGEPYKKRRSRSRKTNTTRDESGHGESSPAPVEGCPLPTPLMPVSSSPLGIPNPSFGLLNLPLRDASASPLTPQPIHAIPPHLLNWGQEARNIPSDELGLIALEPIWPSSNLHTSFQIPHQSDAAFFDSPDAGMFNFQLSLDVSTDFMSALYNPPFGVYLPA